MIYSIQSTKYISNSLELIFLFLSPPYRNVCPFLTGSVAYSTLKKNVEPKLCIWSLEGKSSKDEHELTTNQSEGFNVLLKDFQHWKEVPLDSLLMSLELIQGFYVVECRRGKMGLGNYTLKTKNEGLRPMLTILSQERSSVIQRI